MSEANSNVEVRDVVDFPGYKVSSEGRVWSFRSRNGKGSFEKRLRLLKQYENPLGYRTINLRRGGKTITRQIHRLVMEAFVGKRPKGKQCCHGDGNPRNNHVSNLRWDTCKANRNDSIIHGTIPHGEKHKISKLNDNRVRQMRKDYETGMFTFMELAKKNNVSKDVARKAINRITWRHVV